MKKVKEIIGRLTAGSLRLAALFVVLGLAGSAWAATAPSITVDGANVTVHNDNGTAWDNASINPMSSYQDTTFTIPSGTDLASGTKVLVSTISIGASSSYPGYLPAKLSLTVGGTTYVSKTATVTAGGFTSSGKNKHTYSFDGKYCILTVGTAVSLKWINEDGSEMQGYAAFGLVKQGHQFISRITWGGSVPVTEVTGKIVTVATGALTDIYNRDATPKCLQDATGWISTSTTSTNEVILLNGSNGYGLRLTNGNSLSDKNPNNFSVWPKLSGNGTLTTGDNNWQTPALKIYDASDFTGSINASGGNIYLAVIFCAENDTFSPSVYGEIGSKSGLIYIKSGTSVTVAEGATWTAVNGIVNKGNLTINGTVASAISNVGGTVTVNGGATLASFGSMRDFTGITVDSSVAVKVTMSEEEYGKGLLSISGASGISSITVLAPDGTTVVTTLTPENGAAAYNRGTVLVSGKACWCDYEMDYESGNASKTGFQNTGTESTGLHEDSSINGDSAFYNGMLYTYAHPYRDPITYPSDGNWTAVVRCTVPAYENAAVITFGTRGGGLIGLVAGADPETQMRLVQTTGNSHFITNATMTVQNATTAQHVYIFSVENNQTVKVYCDGDLVLNKTFDSQFSIGNGLQIGSVCGGVGATGIIRFAKGESPANTLSETVQKNARIDCVRLYNYIISPEQVAQLSVEFPAVKLYRATVADGATTDWGSLTWTPSWDGGNTSSKIILTVAGDASLTLTNSITADEFVINVPSDNVLTLSKFASGTTLNVTKPIEVSGGTIFFNPGFAQPIGLGNLNFGGTGTVRLGTGTLVSDDISGSANVEVLSGAALTMYGGSISCPIKGAGLLDYTPLGSLPSALTFGDWTGTVKLPTFTADALNLNNYGKSGSTVELKGVNGGWIAEAGRTIAPKLKLSGPMTIDAMSSWTYTFAEITGSGNLSFSTSANSPTVNITKVAEGYSGTISSTLSNPVTIATLDRAAETPVTAGSKLLSTSSGVQASALTLAGVATSIIPVFDTDGLYVKAASVTKNDTTTNYDTVSAALTAAGNDAATIKLLMPTDSAVALAPGQTLVNGDLTSGGVAGPNGYEVVNNNGTYTLVDNTASTWTGAASDGSWTNGENWSTGFKPTQYTAVTFPANVDGWTVGIPGNAGNEKCASMTLNGDVTFQRGGGDWAKLCVYGAISGEGTLTLNQTCIENDSGSVITIPGPVAIVGSNDSAFLGANGWTIAGNLSVGGYFKTQIPITVTGNAVFAASGAKVETQSAITITGTTTLNGDFSRDTTYGDAQLTFGDVTVAASTTITGAKPTTFAGTVTLADGATLTVPTATTTVTGATFTTGVSGSYVKSEISNANTVYSLESYRTVTFFDEDGETVIQTASNYKLGDTITAPADPTKAATAQYTYTFAGWTPEVAETVTGDATYTAQFSSTVNSYAVTFINEGVTVQSGNVAYGETPAYAGVAPTKASTAEYSYTFAGWEPEIASVTGPATYTATYTPVKRSYTVAFVNEGVTVQSGDVEYGVTPAYAGETPTKESTDEYTYTFAGWTPAIASVTGDAIYTATYTETKRSYTVTFTWEGGSSSAELEYGAMPTAPADPEKYVENNTIYTFAGWAPAVVSVTGVATYTAQYIETPAVAKIGSTYYADLATALNAGKGQGTTVTLLADVDLNGVAWTPVGTAADPFRGTFDGGNHTIRNLSISYNSAATSGATHAGLFGDVNGGTIRNVRMENVTITNGDNPSEQPTASYGGRYGAIVGLINGGSIDSCTVKNVTIKDMGHIGGIAGANTGNTTISDCLVDGTIQLASGSNQWGGWDVGGIIGKNQSGSITVMNCQVDGTDAADSKIYSQYAAGGIVGFTATDSISGCVVKNVTVEAGANAYDVSQGNRIGAGGIIGCLKGTVSDCELDGVTVKYTDTAEGAYAAVGLVGGAQEGSAAVTVSGITVKDSAAYWGDTRVHQLDPGRNTNTAAAPVVTYTDAPVAVIGMNYYNSLDAALDAVKAASVAQPEITLVGNATLAISKSKTDNVLGGEGATKITIDGNGNTLTFEKSETWAQVNTANNAGLVLTNMTLAAENSANYSKTAYVDLENPNHNIAFNCPVELNNVTSGTALSFFKDASLDTVAITDTNNVYSIWIHTSASTVSIKDLVVGTSDPLVTSAIRGIKVDDSFVVDGRTPGDTSITINGATFTTAKKAAVLVRSAYATTVEATGTIDISGVTKDKEHLVWVDEAAADKYSLVTVTGATKAVEPINNGYAATLSTGNIINGYYKTLAAAVTAATTESVAMLKDVTETFAVAKTITIARGGFTAANMTAGEGYTLNTTDEAYTFVDVVEVTLPTIANATITSVTVGGESVTVTAGTVTVTPGAEMVITYTAAEGYVFAGNTTTTTVNWTQGEPAPEPSAPSAAVAQVGTTYYATLAAAIAQVKTDASSERTTVTLLQDTAELIVIDFTYPILIDGQGHGISQTSVADTHTGIKITAPHADVVIENAVVGNENIGRAVNILGAEGVTLLIKDSALYGTMYPLNVYPNGSAGVDNEHITITNSTITGYCALNLWGTNGVVRVVDSTLSGVNDKGYTSDGDNDFGVIALEGLKNTPGANGYDIEVEGSTITAVQTTGNTEYIVLYNPNSQNNTVRLTNCVISRNGDTTYYPMIGEEENATGNSLYVKNTTDAATSAIPELPAGYAYSAPDADGYRQVVKAITFTVDVPEHTAVMVDGEPYTANTEITRTIGTTVTITYAADGAYVAGGTQSQQVTVTGATSSISAPNDYTITEAVAQVGTTYYATLQAALDAVQDGETILILSDITETAYDSRTEKDNAVLKNGATRNKFAYVEISDKSYTIDFGGHTVTTDANNAPYRSVFDIATTAGDTRTVTFTNGTITAVASTINCIRTLALDGTPGTLVLNLHDMTLNNNQGWGVAIKPCNGTTVDLAGTDIYSVDGGNIDVQDNARVVIHDGVFTQTGGVGFTGDWDTCRVNVSVSYGGVAEILGGTFTSSKYGFEVCSSGGTITVDDATATADGLVLRTTGGAGVIEVTGGKFSGAYASTAGDTISISGGVFAQQPAAAYAATGYAVVANTDSETSAAYPWTVALATDTTAVKPDNSTTITDVESVEEAAAEVTIELTEDQVAAGVTEELFTKEVTENNDGTYTVTVKLDETAVKPATATVTLEAENPTIAVANVKKGLYYTVVKEVNGAVTKGTPTRAESTENLNLAVDNITDPAAGTVNKVTVKVSVSADSANTVESSTYCAMAPVAENKLNIVAVPWRKIGGNANTIPVSEVIKTSALNEGDELYVYNENSGSYFVWALAANKTWTAVPTIVVSEFGNAEVFQGEPAEEIYVTRGGAFWVKFADANFGTSKIVLIGEEVTDAGTKQIEAGTTEEPKFQLCASPKATPFQLNAEGAFTGEIKATTRFSQPGDTIQLTVDSGEPIVFYYKNGKWGRTVGWQWSTSDADTTIPVGVGFWYISRDGEPTINW